MTEGTLKIQFDEDYVTAKTLKGELDKVKSGAKGDKGETGAKGDKGDSGIGSGSIFTDSKIKSSVTPNQNDAPAINDAINTAIKGSGIVELSGDKFNIFSPLIIGDGISFVQMKLQGQGASYDLSFPGTRFNCNKDGKIIFQGVRKSSMNGIYIKGVNNANPGNSKDMVDQSKYKVAGLKDEQFDTYMAISIDPKKELFRSSDVSFNDIIIEDFVTGLVTCVDGGDGNGDFIKLENSTIRKCMWGYSSTHPQGRLMGAKNVRFDNCYAALCTDVHGKRNGRMNIADDCHFSGYKTISMSNMSNNGSFRMYNCYGEDLYMIGWVGADNSSASIPLFETCDFQFNHNIFLSLPADYNMITGFAAKFRNCRFYGSNANSTRSNLWGRGVWDSCDFTPKPSEIRAKNTYVYCTANDFNGNKSEFNG